MKDIITRIILLNCYLLHVMKKLAINSMILIVVLPVSLLSQLPFVEDFGDGTVPAGWTFPSNWQVGSVGYSNHTIGNPPPGAYFYWSPAVYNYSERMTSPMISVGQAELVQVFFDMELDVYQNGGLEGLAIEYRTAGGSWIEALSYEVAAGSSVEYPLSTKAYIASVTDSIQLGFRAYGLNSYNLNSWDIDNIRVENILPATQLGSDIDGEAEGDKSGVSVSINSAGDRVAIGAYLNDGTASYAGHVRVYEYSNSSWTQLGSDIDGEAAYDNSGWSVSINSAGDRVAIGAYANNGTGSIAGHVRVYEYSNSSWSQLGSDIDGEAAEDNSGYSVSINSAGDRVAIGAYANDGTGTNAGHVRVYEYSNSSWSQLGSDIDGEAADDVSGASVSMNSAGDRVAIGAKGNDGTASSAGHVRVYEYSNSSWAQLGSDIDGEAEGDKSGVSVSINSAGDRVAIGAHANDGTASNAGHVRVYEYSNSSWTQVGSDIDGEAEGDWSGISVSMNSAGNRVAIGAQGNDGTASSAGHVRVYEYSNSSWAQLGSDIDGEAAEDYSGRSVFINSTGDRVAIGAHANDGTGTNAGHVRVYSLGNSVQTTTYVPDDNFEQALIDLGYDDVLDDYVVTDSISSVTSLDVGEKEISDLTGIEGFTALTELYCSENQLTSLDVSNNTALTRLDCQKNSIDSLDISNNTALIHLNCGENWFVGPLDVSNNTALTWLDCQKNNLTSLDVSNNTALTYLHCYYNDLTSLDVSNNTALNHLSITWNQVTSLDVSNNTALTYLSLGHNQLDTLDVSNNTALVGLYCNENNLDSLDLSNHTALTWLDCHSNGLSYLNMKNGITDALTIFDATDNSLTCIETLDPDYATENWTYENGNIDEGVSFSESCTATISVSPSELYEQLFQGDSSTQVLTISNDGGIDLDWEIGSNAVGDSTAVGDWMVHYGEPSGDECIDDGTVVFSIYEDGTFYEIYCGGGIWTQTGDIITLFMTDLGCDIEWTGTLSGDSIVDGYYGDGLCWNAERLLASTTYINDLTYTGEPIADPVEMTFTPISGDNYTNTRQSRNHWLSIDSTSGTISAGESEDITVTFNATAMDAGSYSTTISITSNDAVDPVINVSVSLDVTTLSVYYVATRGSDSTGDGTYENPFATIQKGIDAANSGDTVSVAAGTYVENISYTGKNISVFGEDRETTIIDGNETASVVVFNGWEDSTAHLSGFTLTNGLPTGAWPASRGGGINCQQASPTLSNLLITGNSSTAGGGGIYLYSGSDAKITDVIIKENIGGWGGGGMYIEGSDAELTNVHIHSNDDGGVKLQNADVSFNYVTISDNESYGMHIEYSEPTFNHVTIVNNDTYGVGLYSTWSHPVFTNSIIANNGTQVTTNQSTGPYGISVSYSNIQGGLDELDSLEFDPDSVNWNSGNIDANPLFCEPDSNNYHLSENSPCLGSGQDGSDMGAFGVGCGTLEIEFPSIVNIWDVPNDQGSWVYIQFNPSAHDASDEGPLGSYTIERLDDEEWVSLHSIDAYGAEYYTTEAHTLMDSTEEDDGMTSYRVIAAMEVGALISEPAEGYSIDNIAPGVPTGLMATVSETGIHLRWDLSPAEDFQYFDLEKSSTADFGEYQVIETADTAYLDTDYEVDVTVYYRLIAYDDGGNASERSVAIDITVLWTDLGIAIPDEFAIHQNYPNPFNPVTTLRYDLPEQGHVRITIYDMLGRDVKTLINEYQDPGYRSIIWDATNDYGKPVSAGMYLYQIQAGEYMEVRKMVLVK